MLINFKRMPPWPVALRRSALRTLRSSYWRPICSEQGVSTYGGQVMYMNSRYMAAGLTHHRLHPLIIRVRVKDNTTTCLDISDY